VRLESDAFRDGDPIPPVHSRDGTDSHPGLAWTGVPARAKSLALVCDDPDAPRGTWVHWVLYDLSPGLSGLTASVARAPRHEAGGTHGTNDYGELGWGGPAPPRGHGVHHYGFRLYALDATLGLAPGATKAQLEAAMKGHVLAEAALTGTYRRD
jgi:Raf kinase inhibitor-like YbhB/YbcL family protein